MLSTIREKTQGIIATFIIVLVAIPFAVWGINSYFEEGQNSAVAEVNGVPIKPPAYRAALEQLRGLDPARGDTKALRELVLEQLINRALLIQDAQDRGYRMSDAQLARMIREVPYFQRDGRFDGELYQAMLRQEGTTAPEFEGRLRRENLGQQIQRGLTDSAFVTAADVDAVLRLQQQQREIAYALIPREKLVAGVRVTPDEVEAYYRSHPEAFQTQEAVRVEYARLSAADAVKQYQPTEEELRQAYAANAERYTTPAKRRASHLLVQLPTGANAEADAKAKERIADIERQLRQGGDFAALAQQHSDDPDSRAKGGDLGVVKPGLLPTELEQALRALAVGQASQPVRTPFGYHLIKLTEYVPEKRRPFEQVRNELADEVRRQKGEERFFEQAERFRTLVYEQPESLQPAAAALELKVEQSDWLTRNGGSGPLAQPRVREVAFNPELIASRRNSDAIELSGDELLALRIIDHKPATPRPLTEVRAEIERQLVATRFKERAAQMSAEWLEQLKQGGDLTQLAKQAGIGAVTKTTVTRDAARDIDRRIVDAAFAAARPAAGQSTYTQADVAPGLAIIAVNAVRDGDPAKVDAAVKEQVRQQLLARRGAEYYNHYHAGLRREADVKIYRDQL